MMPNLYYTYEVGMWYSITLSPLDPVGLVAVTVLEELSYGCQVHEIDLD